MTATLATSAMHLALQQVSDALLLDYAELIYKKTGVRVSPQKKSLLSNRLRRRLRATGIDRFEDYYRYLRKLPDSNPEWDAFLQEVTTHETFLFRDKIQWDWFRNSFLPKFAARSSDLNCRLRVWSAACSTGDEAYTAACCIAACLPDFPRSKIHILGTDIAKSSIEQAKTGRFGERAMRLVPDAYRRSYFTKLPSSDTWQAKPILSEMITFRQHNLMEPVWEKGFDVVFLKNVLIYFDRASKKRVITNLKGKMRPGGMLAVSPTEGVLDLLPDFQRLESWLLCNSAS